MYNPETDVYELSTEKPLVLLLSNICHEGVLSSLRAAGRQYKNKYLESGVKNWEAISTYFDDYDIKAVLIKLSPGAIGRIADENYDEVCSELFKKIASVPNLMFVYEDLLTGSFDGPRMGYRPTERIRDLAFDRIAEFNIDLLPYKRSAEVTVMAQTFLVETEQNLIFRMYVPTGRLWSSESDKFIQLFRGYLSKVASIEVRLDHYRTDKGIIYEIHSEEATPQDIVETEFAEFTKFMDLCVNDPSSAEAMLKDRNIEQKEVVGILSRYSKEAKRLNVDLKQEREQKVLSIRHRLESELVDEITGATNWSTINSLVDMAVPAQQAMDTALVFNQESIQLKGNTHLRDITVNVNPQIISTVHGVVAQEIYGNQSIGFEATQILKLVSEYGGAESQDLVSSVHELEDQSAPKSGRLNAKQKLKKFLISVGKKGVGVATGVLQSYIEEKLGL